MRVRMDRLIGQINAKVSAPKRKDIAEHYRKHREQFRAPETVHASHIVKHINENRDEATARAEIDAVAEAAASAGASFEELADQHSDCAGNGGDLGTFPRGQMVDEFDDVVFEMEPGAVSAVFRTPFGFHIAKLFERQPARVKPLPEVEEEIEAELLRQKQTRALENFVDRLRAKADGRATCRRRRPQWLRHHERRFSHPSQRGPPAPLLRAEQGARRAHRRVEMARRPSPARDTRARPRAWSSSKAALS